MNHSLKFITKLRSLSRRGARTLIVARLTLLLKKINQIQMIERNQLRNQNSDLRRIKAERIT